MVKGKGVDERNLGNEVCRCSEMDEERERQHLENNRRSDYQHRRLEVKVALSLNLAVVEHYIGKPPCIHGIINWARRWHQEGQRKSALSIHARHRSKQLPRVLGQMNMVNMMIEALQYMCWVMCVESLREDLTERDNARFIRSMSPQSWY